MDLSERQQELIAVLDRRTDCDSLSALVAALSPDQTNTPLAETAIGLDASAFLRLGRDVQSDDIVDYLSSKHPAPLIIPGQAVQEFWNNQLNVVDTIASALRKKFESFKNDLAKVDKSLANEISQIDSLLDQFSNEHGHIYDEATARKTLRFLQLLQKRALVPYAARLELREIASQRKKTKTPPGFKDDGDGDFFIWVDFLTGLQIARANGSEFSRIVLVTEDRKLDWTRAGKAHPILVAEAKSLLRVPFEIWTIEKLAAEVAKACESSENISPEARAG